MSDMIQRYEEEAEAFYQATGVMAPGKDAAAAMHGYDADELRHKLWRMWARAVYAERERDEVRHRADRAERILAALLEPSEVTMRQMRETWLNAAVAAAEQEVGRE